MTSRTSFDDPWGLSSGVLGARQQRNLLTLKHVGCLKDETDA